MKVPATYGSELEARFAAAIDEEARDAYGEPPRFLREQYYDRAYEAVRSMLLSSRAWDDVEAETISEVAHSAACRAHNRDLARVQP